MNRREIGKNKKQYKILIYGTGQLYNANLNLIKMYEARGDFEVIGVTSNDANMKNKIDGYDFINKNILSGINFDFCLVAVAEFESIKREVGFYGIDTQKLIPIRILSIPYLTFERYVRLKQSKLSILARNCWGGVCYHYLGLEFLSPTINMFFQAKDFNKFLNNLEYYLSIPMEYVRNEYREDIRKYYPVGKLDDVYVYLNHYESFEEATLCWERRKVRINKDNLLVITSTTSIKEAEEFDKLQYDNKCAFVPFDSNLKSAYKVAYEDKGDGVTFGMISNKIANNSLSNFDILKFCMHQKNYIRIE